MSEQEKLYRPCVGIALFNKEGKVFVGERIDTPDKSLQMPQGGIDPGEDLETAAFRELKEETGTDQAQIIKIAEEKICYDLPEEIRKRVWSGKYAGQEQIWVAMRFTGSDSDIDLNTHDYPEFSSWQWVTPEEAVERIVPFKRELYKKVFTMFTDLPI